MHQNWDELSLVARPFSGIWLFLFNSGYRNRTVDRWRTRSGSDQFATLVEILWSSVIGLALPALLGWAAYIKLSLAA